MHASFESVERRMVTGALVLLFLCGWAAAAPRPPPAIAERTSWATFNAENICPGDRASVRVRVPSTGIVGIQVHLPIVQQTLKAQLNFDEKAAHIETTSGSNFDLGDIDLTPLEMINLLLEFVERGIRLSANGKEVRSFIFSRDPLPCVSAALELYSIGTDVDLRASASARYMKA